MTELGKIKLGHSPLTDTIFLYRHGKNPEVALDKRDAEADVMSVLIDHMMHGAPNGSEKVITLGDKKYTVRVTPNVELRGARPTGLGRRDERQITQRPNEASCPGVPLECHVGGWVMKHHKYSYLAAF